MSIPVDLDSLIAKKTGLVESRGGWKMAEKKRTRLARFFAPGVTRVKGFSVQLVMDSNDSFKIDWNSFNRSKQVKEQMDAAASSQKLRVKHS
jgi:hypothetical protein